MEGVEKAIPLLPWHPTEGVTPIGLVRSTVGAVIPLQLELLSLFYSAKRREDPVADFVSSLVHKALIDLSEKAKEIGADAVYGLKIDIIPMGNRVVVHAYGTAVRT